MRSTGVRQVANARGNDAAGVCATTDVRSVSLVMRHNTVIEQFTTADHPAFDFARLAFAALDSLHSGEYHLRDEPVKRLVEEIVPIAVFAKSLEAPERHLTISYRGPDHPFDAESGLAVP